MAADTLYSNGITDLDPTTSAIITYPNPNDYGPAPARIQSDFVTPTTAGLANTSSLYYMLRLPSTASLRELILAAGAQLDTGGASATLLVDIGAYYSASTTDGTPVVDQGLVISANCFCAAHSFATTLDTVGSGLAKPGDLTINGLYSLNANLVGSPLWKQAGLTADPGGFIDIVVAVHTAANTAVATPFSATALFTK